MLILTFSYIIYIEVISFLCFKLFEKGFLELFVFSFFSFVHRLFMYSHGFFKSLLEKI